jgi:hypothetical protein
MQITHIWNKLNLRRGKITLATLIVCFFAIPSFGQGMFGLTSMSESDNRTLSYGFFLAGHNSTLQLKYTDAFLDQSLNATSPFSSVRSIQSKFSPGFSLGFIGILRLHDQVSMLFSPRVAFYEYKTEVTYFNSTEQALPVNNSNQTLPASSVLVKDYSSEATMIELPLLFKYRSQRFNNTRMYWIGGASYQFRTKAQDEANIDAIVMTGRDVSLEAGMGIEIYFKYFKFAPEIRFSHGMMNAYQAENTLPELQGAIESIRRKSITLFLNFQ